MTSKALNPKVPTVYLDHAAIMYAWRASYGCAEDRRDYGGAAALAALVESWAKDANLCVSLNHVQELADWPRPEAMDVAAWLEGLPLVWTRQVHHVFVDEAAAWIERRLGRCDRSASPWASCVSAVFEGSMTASAQAVIIPRANVPDLVEIVRKIDNRARSVTMQSAKNLYDNNKWAKEQKWSDKRKAEYLAGQRDDSVRSLAKKARDHLRMPWGQEAYDASQGLLEAYRAAPLFTLPAYALQHAGIDDFVEKARVNQLGEKHSSTLWDIAHASVGAAYADVFTCDKRTAEAIREPRQKLGLGHALVNSPEPEFTLALERAVDAAGG